MNNQYHQDHQSKTVKPTFCIESVSNIKDGVQIQWQDQHSSFYSNLWLRDCCRCPNCFQHDTLSFKDENDLLMTPHDPEPETVNVPSNGTLEIVWGGEEAGKGHKSIFNPSWLRAHCQQDTDLKPSQKEQLWDGSVDIPWFDYQDVFHEDEALLACTQQLKTLGVALIDNASKDRESFRALVSRIGPMRQRYHPTNIFTLDTTDNVAKKVQHSYQLPKLRNHTDLTAYDIQGGVQFLQCMQYDNAQKRGEGSSTLVDGFKIAEVLRNENPEFFELLSQEYIPTGRRRMMVEEALKERDQNGKIYEWEAYRKNHVINVDKNGHIYQVRYNHNTRTPLDISPDKIKPMLAAYQAFSTLLESPEYNAEFLLKPGQVLIVNNWRILHGRTAIVTPTIQRVLLGAYVEEETFRSRHRILLGQKSKMDDKWLMGCSDPALEMLAERF